MVHEGVHRPCRKCGKECFKQGNLAEHKRSVHEGVKYPCCQCGKQFTQKGTLAEHR